MTKHSADTYLRTSLESTVIAWEPVQETVRLEAPEMQADQAPRLQKAGAQGAAVQVWLRAGAASERQF